MDSNKIMTRLLGMPRLRKVYKKVSGLYGPEFCAGTLREMGAAYEVPEDQIDTIPAEGAFLTVSNHAFFGSEDLILYDLVGSVRPDFKILTLEAPVQIKNLKDGFILPREAEDHLAAGGSLGLFFDEDAPGCPESLLDIVRNAGVPVIPVFFDSASAIPFRRSRRIHPMLRSLRKAHKMLDTNGRSTQVRIGRPIAAEHFAEMEGAALGKFLRSSCYALEAQCVVSSSQEVKVQMQPLADAVDPELVRAQMARLGDKMLFESGDYRVYLISAADAPDAMHELYRLREETFRGVGEGTGRPVDTDVYDTYYKHLILWNIPNGEIVGSYRLGYGTEIYPERGIAGFYTSTLVHFGSDAATILPRCLELGRSFITIKYQREVLSLKLLLAGLFTAMTQDPGIHCCCGLVSTSDNLPDFYKSLAVHYLKRDYHLPDSVRFAFPTNDFVPNFLRVNPEDLLQAVPHGDIDALDHYMTAISGGKYRLPVLMRKYFSVGARVACFNVDPLFNNSLDAMILLQLNDLPRPKLQALTRPVPEEIKEAMFKQFYSAEDAE